jgi:3'-5' exoribonuclease
LGQTKNGKPFIKCLLGDRTGRSPGRMWNASEELFSILPTDGFVAVEGQVQPYQGEMQIIIHQIRAAEPTDADLLELLPCTSHDIEAMYAEVVERMATVEHEALKALVDQYMQDDELMQAFRRAPAAMALHHAYIGGLLEHTLSLLRLADVFCPLYPQLNRDVIMVGVFLHDLAKCVELTWERGFGYSDEGQLVGHIARGVIWLERKAADAAAMGHKVPEPLLRVLHHIILSHHGRPEYGAQKIPATPEAIAISQLDNLDAKVHMAIQHGRGESNKAAGAGGNFTEKIWALETRLYRPDPTTIEDE